MMPYPRRLRYTYAHMKASGLPFLLIVLAFAAACTSQPKISAKEMKHQLMTSVYDFNQALNSADIDAAESFVAPQAKAAFDKLVAGYKANTYNMFQTNDPPEIDYVGGKGHVNMSLYLGKQGKVAGAYEVESQRHLWVYSNGGWQWAGPAAR